MVSPSWKAALAPDVPGRGPRPLARDLVNSVDDAEGLYVAVQRCLLCNGSSESDSATTSSTVSKFAEARRTTYLSGQWVCDDHNRDTSISITGPWMLNTGDHSANYSWVEEKKTMQGPDMEHNSPADTISAALCTQLVNILSHTLNVNLLKRVKFDQLQPLHMNLMYLVRSSSEHLGRSGPFEVRADLEESMEFVDPGVTGEADESGDEHISNEETDLGTDWQNLPSKPSVL
ncbi:hypothetical protein GW7_20601 [Heterocephalus glaber]|uniref:Beclin 1-associated autophagy-related key regulator n=1 Tax=Heterocephalus glaber TaxID=10181 RepID=G5ANT7_HETGA|nr:hypothetical protein GW7_20601 [Heterocephalus glaber]